jgi:hypothetical protein
MEGGRCTCKNTATAPQMRERCSAENDGEREGRSDAVRAVEAGSRWETAKAEREAKRGHGAGGGEKRRIRDRDREYRRLSPCNHTHCILPSSFALPPQGLAEVIPRDPRRPTIGGASVSSLRLDSVFFDYGGGEDRCSNIALLRLNVPVS